jgi:hypothetical protein
VTGQEQRAGVIQSLWPRRFPAWLASLVAGEAAVSMGTDARGASNAKARRELGWTPRYPSWRKGFPAVYSALDAPGLWPERRVAGRLQV